MEGIFTAEAIIGLITLAVLEIVLGIDNIIFISILAGKLPQEQQGRARTIGLALAMITRILLLLSISWIIRLEDPLFRLPLPFLGEEGREISGRDLILFGGGLFLVGKATYEIHEKLEAEPGHSEVRIPPSFTAVIVQILLLDIVFSLDSVITAVGMVDQIWVMIAAVIIAVGVMLFSAGAISEFVNRHPTVKMLALAFLILIGVNLMAEGAGQHIPKGYIYFAMAFSVFVELLNMRLRAKTTGQHPVELRAGYTGQTTPAPARAVAQPQAERSH
ncbi:TerC family protein [Kallotenue papyrolyticum]|uniref:TerC family protein n=1 Tax=Kallotenue papyrolyticum TaxID=1325125 RepID=UPI000478606C|nr:TerC family protein [Kallotenue papyrolyticum]